MARLADALQRANRRREVRDGAHDGPVALEVAPQVRSRVPERVALAPGGTPLLDFSTGQAEMTGWRTDPELVGKLVGTEDFSSGAARAIPEAGRHAAPRPGRSAASRSS